MSTARSAMRLREFLDRDRFRQLNLALNFDALLLCAQRLKFLTFALTLERSEAALLLLFVERIGQRQALTAGSLVDGLLGRRRRVPPACRNSPRFDLAFFFVGSGRARTNAVYSTRSGRPEASKTGAGLGVAAAPGPRRIPALHRFRRAARRLGVRLHGWDPGPSRSPAPSRAGARWPRVRLVRFLRGASAGAAGWRRSGWLGGMTTRELSGPTRRAGSHAGLAGAAFATRGSSGRGLAG